MSRMDWERLERYLARECDAEEREQVERWMAEAPANRSRVELLAEALSSAPVAPRAEVWQSVERQLGAGRKSFSLDAHPARSSLAKIAALLLVVGGGAMLGYAILSSRHETLASAPAMRVVTTPPGQRASFRLPDGTSVMLGVASTLRHPMSFGAGAREVQLEGEAYFEVVHDEGRPFTVRAGDVVVEDLGTQFIVRAYHDDRHAHVVVREGKVALQAAAAPDSNAKRVIQPGHLGRLADGGTPVIEQVDTAAYFAWTEGRLVLDGVPLRDALPQLSRWFDLDFRLADSSLGDVPLTTTLKTQPSPEVLNLLASSLGMRQVRNGRTVTFYPAAAGR